MRYVGLSDPVPIVTYPRCSRGKSRVDVDQAVIGAKGEGAMLWILLLAGVVGATWAFLAIEFARKYMPDVDKWSAASTVCAVSVVIVILKMLSR